MRAWEKLPTADEDEDAPKDRKWLIQCKREQKIGPTKARAYAKDIVAENSDLYGVLFVASCDLSKDARDAIREELALAGVQEAHIWTRSEIEDQLFQPKNDHLLFAYFGFSLVRRRASTKTKIRARLATKKKVQRIFGSNPYKPVLIRDANFDDYPYVGEYSGKKSDDPPLIVTMIEDYFYDGIVILIKRYKAYIDKDKKEWDYEPRYDQTHPVQSAFTEELKDSPKDRAAFFDFHRNLPDANRYFYVELGYIPYENILEVDESGDEYFDNPHIFVQRFPSGKLYGRPYMPSIHPDNNFTSLRRFDPKKYKRVKIFPKIYRSKKQPKPIEPLDQLGTVSEEPFPGLNDK